VTYENSNTYIVNGNIVIFIGTHTNAYKEDILHACLFANLTSNIYSFAASDWFKAYNKTLSNLYWSTQSLSNKNIKKQPISLLKSFQLAESPLTLQETQNVREQLSTIMQLADNSAALRALLDRIQLKTDEGAPQARATLCPVVTVINEHKLISSISLLLNITRPVGIGFLEEALPEGEILGDVQIIHWSASLHEGYYAAVRDKIIQKLGSRIKTSIFAVETPTLPLPAPAI
jgi:hypothetical protein